MHASPTAGHVARVWTLPPAPQDDITTCWEAGGRMLFFWRHRHDQDRQGVRAAYRKAAGEYLGDYFRKGLEAERDFYVRHLGMREGKGQSPPVVEKYLKDHSPLVIRVTLSGGSHVVVLTGCSDRNWYFIDPQVFNRGPATHHTFGAHTVSTDTGGNQVYDENTVITPHGAYINPNQSSWHAALRHWPKDKLFAQMKPEFFYYKSQRLK
jgi:hypothetical protein